MQIVVQVQNDALADAPDGPYAFAHELRDRWIEGLEQRRRAETDTLHRLPGDAGVQRVHVQADLRKFGHAERSKARSARRQSGRCAPTRHRHQACGTAPTANATDSNPPCMRTTSHGLSSGRGAPPAHGRDRRPRGDPGRLRAQGAVHGAGGEAGEGAVSLRARRWAERPVKLEGAVDAGVLSNGTTATAARRRGSCT